MKVVLSLILVAALFGMPKLCAQTCSGGGSPDSVSLSVTGMNSWDELNDPDNERMSLCGFMANANMVGLEWANIDLSPLGSSWCSEVAFNLSDAVSFRPAISERNEAPCSNGYSGGSPSILQDNNLVFQADASGCIVIELYETYDDDPNQIDANITAGSITLYACPAAELLPIELIDFSGEAADDYNLLKWVTASEINSRWHIIERSITGLSDWSEIGREQAKGAANEATSYELKDESPLPFAYYRLREVGFEGGEEFSPIISIRRDYDGFGISFISPNPGSDRVALQYNCSQPGIVEANLYDSSGKLMVSTDWPSEKGANWQYLNISTFAQGIYTIVLNNGYENVSTSLIKK